MMKPSRKSFGHQSEIAKIVMPGVEFEIEKFNGHGNFKLWQIRVKDLLAQQGLLNVLRYDENPCLFYGGEWEEMKQRASGIIRFCLTDEIVYHVMNLWSPVEIWNKLESQFMFTCHTNRLYLKRRLYGLKMQEGNDLTQHVNDFYQIITDLALFDVKIDDEDKALILLCSLPSSYEHIISTLLCGKETVKLEEIISALLAHNKAKQNAGDFFYAKG